MEDAKDGPTDVPGWISAWNGLPGKVTVRQSANAKVGGERGDGPRDGLVEDGDAGVVTTVMLMS